MKVRMLQSRIASPDGKTASFFEAGRSYVVPDDLGKAWIASSRAEEDKMIESAPEISMAEIHRGSTIRSGPKNVTLVVEQGTSPLPVPPPGEDIKKPLKKKGRK